MFVLTEVTITSHEGPEGLSDPGKQELGTWPVSVGEQTVWCPAAPWSNIRCPWGTADTWRVLFPGDNFQRLAFQVHRTHLLSGYCSSWDLLLLLLAEPETSHITTLTLLRRSLPQVRNLQGGFGAVLSGWLFEIYVLKRQTACLICHPSRLSDPEMTRFNTQYFMPKTNSKSCRVSPHIQSKHDVLTGGFSSLTK